MSDFTHLHVHSHYSLLDGLGKIQPLLVRAKELGMDSLALTDHGSMYGTIEFIKAAKEINVKPIIGVEAYLAPKGHTKKRGKIDANPRHLTLIAKDYQGYKNLLQLTTRANLDGYYYKPRIDYQLLQQYSEGLIVLSGCLNGDIPKAVETGDKDGARKLIKWHLEVFGKDRFYLEVQDHPNLKEQKKLNEALVGLSKEFKVGLVATADSHYIHADDAEAQDVLLCVQTGKTVEETDRMSMLDDDFSLKSPQEVKESWKDHPEAVDNTMKISEMCNVELEFGVNRLPHYPLPKGKTADEVLRDQCVEGLKHRYGNELPEDANERLDYELGVIGKTGFASYFLIVADFVNEAKRRDILVGPGRGSAAGSLVSYLMNITNLDPLYYNLLFERFLNPDRLAMPDIDLDFADDRRDEVIEYVRKKYGADHVAQIITFGTMAARAAVRDVGRALGFPYAFCDRVAKAIPPFTNFEEALNTSKDLKELYDGDPQVQKLIDTAKKLEGVCRHASTHAAGVIITEKPLTEYVPLQLSSTGSGEMDTVTQYAMGAIEDLGLLKIDFLGLKNLTIIQNALKLIEERYDKKIDLDTIPLDDELAYKLLQEAKTTGVFQLESSGMKRYLKQLKPTEFEDIISIGALYRPGPMDSIPDFIAAKHGKKKITYLHPVLKPILEKTYGVIVTQDQVLQIARDFAGFTYGEADILRKAVGKKIKALLDEQRDKFIKGANEKKSIDIKTAEKVWDFIEPFARYGFNRAHAACYAMIAYQTAYLKAHYPPEFMAALLTSDEGNIDRAAIEVAEALSMDIAVLPPDINESDNTFTVIDSENKQKAIRFGLGAIKNVGHNAVEAVISERKSGGKFTDLPDLFRRINSKDFNRKSVESMAKAGTFDALGERNQILQNCDRLLEFNRQLHKTLDAGQKDLFGGQSVNLVQPSFVMEEAPEATKDERLNWEKELLGMYVSEHPLTEWQKELNGVVVPLSELQSLSSGQTIRIAGVIVRLTKIVTKSQKTMLFVLLEDLAGKVETLVFPALLDSSQELWADGKSVVIEGTLSDKDGEAKVLANKVWELTHEILQKLTKTKKSFSRKSALSPAQAKMITIHVPRNLPKEKVLEIKKILTEHNQAGGLAVELVVPRGTGTVRLATQFKLAKDDSVPNLLVQIVGPKALELS